MQSSILEDTPRKRGRPFGSRTQKALPGNELSLLSDEQRAILEAQQTIIASKTIDITLKAIQSERGMYDNMPPFQRGVIWSTRRQRYLIDSILRGFPLPPLLLNRKMLSNGRMIYEVVDGQQRLRSILDFYDGKFGTITAAGLREFDPTEIPVIEPGRKYHQLPGVWRGQFDAYSLRCVVLDNANSEMLRVFFRRLQNQEQLSNGELLWSYVGKGAELARKVGKEPIWNDLYRGKVNRRQSYEVGLAVVTMEAYGLPVSLRTPTLQSIASPLSDDKIDEDMEHRVLRRVQGMNHLFAGVECTSKSEMLTLYQAVMLLEQAGVDVLHSEKGCLYHWYVVLRQPTDTHYPWGVARIISQIHNVIAQNGLWEKAKEDMLTQPGLYYPPVFLYRLSPSERRKQNEQENADAETNDSL